MDAIDCARKGDLEYFKNAPPDVLLNARDDNDDNILSMAIKRCYTDCCEVICRRCPSLLYHQDRPHGYTPLHHAAYAGKIEIVKLIICACVKGDLEYQEADIESKGRNKVHPPKTLTMTDTHGENAIHKAMHNNQLEAVKLLIEADPNNEMLRAGNKTGETPLHFAINKKVLNSSPDMLKLILEKQPSQAKERVGNNGWTALHHSVSKGFMTLVGDIIQWCPESTEVVDNEGRNFLHLAARLGDVNMVEHILGMKVIPLSVLNGQDNLGKTPLDDAAICENESIVSCLVLDTRVEKKLTVAKHLHWVVQKHNFTMMNLLMEAIPDFLKGIEAEVFLNSRDENGDTILFKAAKKNHLFLCKEIYKSCPSLQTGNGSGTGVTMMEVCDTITSSLSKLAFDKPQSYSRAQLKEFTKDFSQPLGSGGFGDVYKGQFPDGVYIAVKVLKNIEFKEKIMEEQFVAEVDTMGRTYHCNLIKLYGYCYEANTKYKALIYDYMENGSFDTILFEKKLDIPWAKLHNIAKEIAQGISYLHESCKPQIIHQDIKPANVLLDSNLSPKVIDFGLAKVNKGESQFEQTKIKGSPNYMAPEVNQPQQVKLSCKLDVYSYGKMLFDILGSKRNHVDKIRFPGQVWEKYKTNQLDKFILECGINEEDKENAKRLAIIALLCVEHNPRARPMLSNVVKMLEGKIKLDTPIAPVYPVYYSSGSSSLSDSRDY